MIRHMAQAQDLTLCRITSENSADRRKYVLVRGLSLLTNREEFDFTHKSGYNVSFFHAVQLGMTRKHGSNGGHLGIDNDCIDRT